MTEMHHAAKARPPRSRACHGLRHLAPGAAGLYVRLLRTHACAAFFTAAAFMAPAQDGTAARHQLFDGYRSGFHAEIVALQTLLDRQHLSPNCIDGIWGLRTEIALLTWQTLRGLPVTGIPDGALLESFGPNTNIYTTYTVTTNDLAALCTIPESWEARAAMPRLGYETIQEMVAEKGHISQRGLERLNPSLPWPNPPAGTVILLPDITTAPLPRAASIHISLGRTEVVVYDASGTLVALFPCSIAAEKKQRPAGELLVQAIAPNPNYTYDPQLFFPGAGKTARLIIPPGPNNPVGMAWISLSRQGYGIHGTPVPERIGRAESKGCFRLANWNAVKLLHMVEIGIPVFVEE